MIRERPGYHLLAGSVSVSALLHVPLFWPLPVHHLHSPESEFVELDLVGPSRPPAGKPGAPSAKPAAKDWVLPKASVSAAPQQPVPHAPETAEETTGAAGTGEGEGGSAGIKPPVLLNHGELHRLLRRLYPESERALGREGIVVLSLQVQADGRVGSVEVVRSGGQAFDETALRVAERLRYSPALAEGRPVGVRLRQAVIFKLEQ